MDSTFLKKISEIDFVRISRMNEDGSGDVSFYVEIVLGYPFDAGFVGVQDAKAVATVLIEQVTAGGARI